MSYNTDVKHVHFLGIGGSGASAAAAIAKAQGYVVSGCDKNPHNEFTSVFKESQLLTGHDPSHLLSHPGDHEVDDRILQEKDSLASLQNDNYVIDILAVTPAIYSLDPNNPELEAAHEKGIPVMTWQEFLGKTLTKDMTTIAVCGTHGKSTTTAMIAKLLEDANMDPSVVLGAIIPDWKANYRAGKSKYFVVEADEFNDNFLNYTPTISVVTTIEMDHPEYFKDFDAVKMSFKKFLGATKQSIVANMSDPGIVAVIPSVVEGSSNWQIATSPSAPRNDKVEVIDYSQKLIDFPLQIPGEFNVYNASAVYQVGILLGIKPEVIKKSLQDFKGIGRRFELLGEYNGAKIYSDFGHHPTEIKVTMEAARQKFPNNRIMMVFQPHMFSRTKALFADFVKMLQELPIDKTFILDIYPSREVDTGLVTSQELVEAVKADNIIYIGKSEGALEKVKPEIKTGDIVFFMGAGDTDKIARELINEDSN